MPRPITEDFVRRIPKTELHVHLDGSLRIPTLVELAKAGKVKLPSYSEAGLREKVFKDFYKEVLIVIIEMMNAVCVIPVDTEIRCCRFQMRKALYCFC